MRQHLLTQRHPVLSALLFSLAGFISFALLPPIFNQPLHALFPSYPALEGPVGVVICALLVLGSYRLHFRPEPIGFLTGGKPSLGLRLSLFYLAYLLLSCFITFGLRGAAFHFPSFEAFSTSLLAGVGEEICFRGLLLGTLMRQWRRQEKLLPALLISSLLFSFLHLSNLLVGAEMGITILQILASLGAGSFFAAVYIRSANLWPVILLHFLQNVLAFCAGTDANQAGILTASVDKWLMVDSLICLLLLPLGLYLLRGEKGEEILQIWKQRWEGEKTLDGSHID